MPGDEIKETSEYGKMSVWQWIIVYIAVGVMIYGIFYAFLLYKNKTVEPPTQAQPVRIEESQDKVDLGKESEVEDPANKSVTEIQLTDEEFFPNSVTITKETTVIWTNNSSKTATVNSSEHPTHLDYPLLNLGKFEPGESLTLVFNEVGTYKYHNHLNPSQTGTVEVIEEDLGTENEQSLVPQEQ
jgi:plastocyanin